MKFFKSNSSLFLFFLVLLFIQPVFSQNNPKLRINVIPRTIRQRTDGPVPVFIQSDWQGTAPLTGVLEIAILQGNQPTYFTRSQEITFPPGYQTRSMMLPPLLDYFGEKIRLEISFITKNGTFKIPIQQLMLLEQQYRCYSIGIISTPLIRKQKIKPGDALRLEKFLAKEAETGAVFRTGINYLNIEQLPGTVAEYCAYNLLLLQGVALAEMPERQLKVLKEWVCAGGSLCVIIDEEIESDQLNFLNSLVSENLVKTSSFILDGEGKLLLPTDFPKKGPKMYYPGLGRMAVFPSKIPDENYFRSKSWREVSAFLWRIRGDVLSQIVNKGLLLGPKKENQEKYADFYKKGRQQQWQNFNQSGGTLPLARHLDYNQELFMSQSFRMIPTWVLVVLLVSLVLLVGPIDYFVLGKLGCRRFTWLLFPFVCIIYTALTIFIARYYMGVRDHIGKIVIYDEGTNGQVFRKTTYEVVFTAGSKNMTKQCKNSFFAIQSRSNFVPLIFNGNLFSDYQATYFMKQWVPKITRTNAFVNEPSAHPNWQFPEELKPGIWTNLKQLKIRRPGWEVKAWASNRIDTSDWIDTYETKSNNFLCILGGYMVSANADENRFSWFAGAAPSPEYGKDSLLMMDSYNPEEFLVVVAEYNPEKREMNIYRRLYIIK